MVYAEINGQMKIVCTQICFKMFHVPHIFVQYNIMEYYEGQSKSPSHFQLRSQLLNAFKSYFIFRKSWLHSLNNANIKKISAVVPKITELEYTRGSLSVPRQF